MSEIVNNLGLGFSVALSLQNLALCFIGCLVGTLIGVLPGVGPIATIAMLLPITFGARSDRRADHARRHLLRRAVRRLDHGDPGQHPRRGDLGRHRARRPPDGASRAAPAWRSASRPSARSSPACVATARHRGARRAADQARAASSARPSTSRSWCMGLVFAVVLARGSILKAIAMILLGVLLSTVGTDLETGEERMTFGLPSSADGIDFAVLAMGMFGIAEILRNLEHTETPRRRRARPSAGCCRTREDFKQSCLPDRCAAPSSARSSASCPATARCSGRSPPIRSRRSSPRIPRRFGRGAIEGVAGPEIANNAGAQTSFIPLLTLGIPPNAVMALMVGAMTIHGIVPGPAGHDQATRTCSGA